MSDEAVILVIVGIITTVLWLIIGWRAMRAHERLADALEQVANKLRESR